MNYLKKISYALLLVCCITAPRSYAEPSNSSFLYIQGDKKTPFYVKVGGEMLPKYGKNYYVISQLPAGVLGLDIIFQQNVYPQQHFVIQVPENGYREFTLNKSEHGFVLYDMQQRISLSSGNNEDYDHMSGGAAATPQNNSTVNVSALLATVNKQPYPASSNNLQSETTTTTSVHKTEPAFIENVELNNVHPQQKNTAVATTVTETQKEIDDNKSTVSVLASPQKQTITIKAPESKEQPAKTEDDENYHFVSITQKPEPENKIIPQKQSLQSKQNSIEPAKAKQTYYDEDVDTVQYTPYNVNASKPTNNSNTDNYTVEVVTPTSSHSRTITTTTTYNNQYTEQQPVVEREQYSNNTSRQQTYNQDNFYNNQPVAPNNTQYSNSQENNYYRNNGNNGYNNSNNYQQSNYFNHEQRPDYNRQGYFENSNNGVANESNNNRLRARGVPNNQQNNQDVEYSQYNNNNNGNYYNDNNSTVNRQQYADNYNNNYNSVDNNRYENTNYNTGNVAPTRNPKIQYIETNDPNDSYSPCEKAMDSYSFNELFRGMTSQDDAERKMNYILKNYNKYCYSTAQLRMLAQAMDNERRRYAILKKTYQRTVDKENFESLKDLFYADEWRSLFRQIELQ